MHLRLTKCLIFVLFIRLGFVMSGKQLRLRVRLQLTATALSTLLLGLGAWAAPAYFSHTMRLEAENHAHTQLTQLKGHIEAPLAFSDQETVLLELQKLGVDALSYAEVQANGTMMVRIDTKAEAPKGPPFIIDKPYIWQEGNTIHGALRFKSALDEAVTLRVGFAMGRLVEAEENLQRSALAASLLLASGLWLLLYLLGVRMLRPIEQTTRLADAIAGGRLASVTVPELDTLPTDGDELARLERAFTMMVYELREKRTALEQSREGLEAQVAKQTEKLSKALEQAQAASRAKSRFLANMSHEIRTPMNGVLGMARVLKGTPMNSEQRDMVAIIEDTGRTLMSLLNQILDMSRVESGRLVLEDLLYVVRPAF